MKKTIILLAIFLLIPLSSAVVLEAPTVLNTSVSNSSMTFVGCTVTTDEALVEATKITLTNNSFDPEFTEFNFPDVIVWEVPNRNADCGEFNQLFGSETTCTDISGFNIYFVFFPLIMFVGVFVFLALKLFGGLNPQEFSALFVAFITIIIVVTILIIVANKINAIC